MIHTALLILAEQLYAPILLAEIPSFKRIKVLNVKRVTDYRIDKSIILCQIGDRKTNLTFDHVTNSLSANYDKDLFYQYHGGSGDLGICVIGLPGIILLSPIWLSIQGFFKLIEWLTNMDRWSWTFFLRIGGQLNPNLREKVKVALKKSY